MADLIDRDALLREAEVAPMYAVDALVCYDLIKSAPAVNRWISVEDALPETDTPVICYMRSGQILVMVLSDDDGWYCGVTRYYPRSVTHWAYLPEPPEKE